MEKMNTGDITQIKVTDFKNTFPHFLHNFFGWPISLNKGQENQVWTQCEGDLE